MVLYGLEELLRDDLLAIFALHLTRALLLDGVDAQLLHPCLWLPVLELGSLEVSLLLLGGHPILQTIIV